MPIRDYLGLSEIGQCARRVFYNHDPETHIEPSATTQALMDMGVFLEPYVRQRRGGVEDDQVEVTLGEAKGHIDGLIYDLDLGRILWECKATTNMTISKWHKQGLPRYYMWQVQAYMAALSETGSPVTKCYLDALDRVSGRVETFVIEADEEMQKAIRLRIANLSKALKEKALPGQEFAFGSPECNACPYFNTCWGYAEAPTDDQVTVEDASEWAGFREAIELYLAAQQEAAEAKENEDLAKKEILNIFKAQKAKGGRVGNLKAVHIWVEQNRFDTKLFHEKEPELWDKYKKTIKFPRLEVKRYGEEDE